MSEPKIKRSGTIANRLFNRQNKAKLAAIEAQETERREKERVLDEQLATLQWQVENERKAREAAEEKAAREASRIAYEEEQKKIQERETKERELEKERERKAKAKTVSPEKLRELRDLIRLRYELDVEIWNYRGVRLPDRPLVEEKMQKADAVLQLIIDTIRGWGGTEEAWTAEELDKIEEVWHRITADGKRWWMQDPPWNDK
jgi:hypothetical protein